METKKKKKKRFQLYQIEEDGYLRCNREKSTDSNDDDAQSKGTPELRSKAILIQDKGLVVTREKIRRYLMKLYKTRKKRWRSERIEVKRERERERERDGSELDPGERTRAWWRLSFSL